MKPRTDHVKLDALFRLCDRTGIIWVCVPGPDIAGLHAHKLTDSDQSPTLSFGITFPVPPGVYSTNKHHLFISQR